ncbi:MAG: hypothetical protein MUO31_04850 [Thermodesulfovibrionales bacterium]|nr:hypothetical protein [Thermodesulfovibrionales bacterium]
MLSRLSSLFLVGLVLCEILLFSPVVDCTTIDNILGQNFYFHRELSGIGNYRFLNSTFPSYSDSKNVTQTIPVGVWEIGDGWITNAVPRNITLERAYNFLFSVWGGGGGNAMVFFKFYAYRSGVEHFLFTSNPSEQLIVNASELLWQHRTREVSLSVLEGDRLVLRLFLDVSVAGTFGLGYDCVQYPSYVNDPTETRYMRLETGSVNGGTFQWLNTSQGVIDTNSQRNLASVSSEFLYPTSDVAVSWQCSSGSVHYSLIDEASYDDADSVGSKEPSVPDHKVDLYGHTALSTSSPISRISLIVRRRGYGSIYVGWVIGGTFYFQTITAGGASWAFAMVWWDSSPASGVGWTKSEVNGASMQIQQHGTFDQIANVSQLYARVYYYSDSTCYWGFTVCKRDSGGSETTLTSGVQTFLTSSISAFLLDGGRLYNVTWSCPLTVLSSTDSVVVGVFYKVSVGSWYLHTGYNFSTSQLGGELLNGSVWTLHFYLYPSVSVTYVYCALRWGSSIYNSRIEGFVWTEATKVWQNVSTWGFQLLTRQWTTVGTWGYQLLTRQWINISTWNFQLVTMAWNTVGTWTLQILPKQWNMVETWALQFLTRQWTTIDAWLFQLDVLGWHTISTWVFVLGGASNIPVLFIGLAFFSCLALAIFGLRLKKRRL